MQRIKALKIEEAPEESQGVMNNIKENFGKVPNIFASLANSPVSLKSLMGIMGALGEGELAGIPQEAVALRIGELNGCEYCTAAHTAKAKMAGASEEDTISFRKGKAGDPKLQAIINLAESIANKGTDIADEDIEAARSAGISDAEILEILSTVIVNIFTNYTNAIVETEVDFPVAPKL